ncbi:hypothetical protein I2I05_18715 [Hymenobacter sp. BT683]|uniref:Uncharacterized protein n=1 Tax=Hymenobacter jeongseonensis TaxID=2791027 RepID=A0ABS0IM30_9BACT|nr:hypothetical protein [Hymenobacter jeongseonensis]MBF9239432.1 hypothetical protein [Hymenobacter jeongseonensis]
MRITASFSALPRPAQWMAARQLRRDIVCRLGQSTASLTWWRQALLEVNPLLEWTNDQRVIVVRRGRTLLDRVARCYLLSLSPGSGLAASPDPIDEELLGLLP